MKCFGKMLLTALAGWAALNVAMLLTFRLIGFGLDGHGLLMNPQTQSAKLIAVWGELRPLPRIVAQPASMIVGLYGFAFLHAVIYRMLSPALPSGAWRRGLRLSGLLFGVCYSFWEFFTPFNLFGEPWPLIGVELMFWATVALAEGLAIAAVAERMWPANNFVERLIASEQTGVAGVGCSVSRNWRDESVNRESESVPANSEKPNTRPQSHDQQCPVSVSS